MAKHPRHDPSAELGAGKDDDDEKNDGFGHDEPTVVEAPAVNPFAIPNPSEARAAEKEPVLEGVRKGDMVRLLVAHYDGYQRHEAGAVVRWWNDTPPTQRNCAHAEEEQTPLTAPAMTDGRPPDDYTDPATGRKPVIGSA